MRRRFTRPACRWCSRATTTSCRPIATSIRPSPGTTTRWFSRKAAPPFGACSHQGWIDAIRTLHPDEPMYTFWDYMRKRWERDAGLRIDHPAAQPRGREAARRRRRRSRRARQDERQRSCAGLDRACATVRDGRAKPRGEGATKATRQARASRQRAASPPQARPRAPPAAGDRRRHLSRTAPITRCRRRSCGAAASPPARSSASRISCCGSTTPSSRAPCSSAGTRWKATTYRHEAFPDYQSGREFDDALVEQLDVLPEFVAACGFANAKAAGYEADDFLAAAVAAEEKRGGTALVASGDRDTFQLASERTTILYPLRAGEMARIGPAEVRERYGVDPAAGAGFHRAARRSVGQAAGRARRRSARAPPTCCNSTARSKTRSRPAAFRPRPRSCASTARSPPWMRRRRCRALARSDADLGEGGGARPQMGAQPARRPSGEDDLRITLPALRRLL